MDTPGLIFLCRDSAATVGSNHFDHPLSSRFDEQDAFAIFDDVEVPRDRVFIDGDIEVYNSVMGPTAWWPNIMQQTTIRALTKLEFAYGLACRMAEAVNDVSAPTLEMLGELSSYVEVTRNAILLSEEHAHDRGDGAVFPDARAMHPMRSMLAVWYPRVREILMLIGSHNLLATPSRGDARRRQAAPADRRVPARCQRHRRRAAGARSTDWRGTSSGPDSVHATSCTSATTWARPGRAARSTTWPTPTRSCPTPWSTRC